MLTPAPASQDVGSYLRKRNLVKRQLYLGGGVVEVLCAELVDRYGVWQVMTLKSVVWRLSPFTVLLLCVSGQPIFCIAAAYSM